MNEPQSGSQPKPLVMGSPPYGWDCDGCDECSLNYNRREDAEQSAAAHVCKGRLPCGCPVRLADEPDTEPHYAGCEAEQDYDYSFERSLTDDD